MARSKTTTLTTAEARAKLLEMGEAPGTRGRLSRSQIQILIAAGFEVS